jgi:hypothetical protein
MCHVDDSGRLVERGSDGRVAGAAATADGQAVVHCHLRVATRIATAERAAVMLSRMTAASACG